jgi:hypothetical protein
MLLGSLELAVNEGKLIDERRALNRVPDKRFEVPLSVRVPLRNPVGLAAIANSGGIKMAFLPQIRNDARRLFRAPALANEIAKGCALRTHFLSPLLRFHGP